LETTGKDLRFKRNVFGGLFVTLILISTCLVLMPVTFTEADLISVIPNP
jgi:hypothetical protein